jgi:hypothetical protein
VDGLGDMARLQGRLGDQVEGRETAPAAGQCLFGKGDGLMRPSAGQKLPSMIDV